MQAQWLKPDNRNQVKLFYRQFMPYARLHRKEAVFTVSQQDIIIASIRLRPIGRLTLLTGMLVHPEYRGQNLAHTLMTTLKETLKSESTFLFAIPELVPFYKKHHFTLCSEAPNDIQQQFNQYHSKDKPLVLMAYSPPANKSFIPNI